MGYYLCLYLKLHFNFIHIIGNIYRPVLSFQFCVESQGTIGCPVAKL